jgi:hypothetical protein
MHTATEDKTDDNFYDEIQHIFNQFPKSSFFLFFLVGVEISISVKTTELEA